MIDALFDESAGNGGSDGISPLPSGPSIAKYPYLPTDLWYALPELEKELDVTMLSDARFNGILDADGLNQTLEVWVNGAMIATLENGGAVDFVDLFGRGEQRLQSAGAQQHHSADQRGRRLHAALAATGVRPVGGLLFGGP